jgi:hypothetical protein
MSGLDTSQPITDEVVLHEGHVHAEQKKEQEQAAREGAQPEEEGEPDQT